MMNFSSGTNKNDLNALIQFTTLNCRFIVPIISCIGFVLNSLCIIVFMGPKFTDRSKFKYVLTKLVLEMIVCLIGSSFPNFKLLRLICRYEHFRNTSLANNIFLYQILRLVFNYFFHQVLIIWIGLNEVLLTWNRYLILRKNDLFEKYFIYIVIGCGIGITLYSSPLLLALKVVPLSNETNLYYLEKSVVGNTALYSFSILTSYVTGNLISSICLIILSVLIVIEFKKFLYLQKCKKIQNKRTYKKLVYKEVSKKKTEIKMIKMTLIINLLFLIARILGCAEILVYRLLLLGIIRIEIFYIYLCNINVIAVYLIMCSNIFILINFNNRFYKNLKIFLLLKS